MQEQSFYYFTIAKTCSAEFKDRGSRFIAYAYAVKNVDDVKLHLKEIKDKHPKANHYCYAYKLGIDNNNYRSSDAGEPRGSAGLPILNQILSKQLTNVLVIVVRYFGGTLLGVSGLVNAYKTAATLCLQITPIVQKDLTETFIVTGDYSIVNDMLQIVKRFNGTCHQANNMLFVELEIDIPLQHKEQVLYLIKDIKGAELNKKD